MIIPDINLLVYAYNIDAPLHAKARKWWENALSGHDTVGLPWVVCLGFVRLISNRKVCLSPMEPLLALHHIGSWMARPQAQVLQPGPRHLDILETFAKDHVLTSELTTDAHLAALAIETQAVLNSNDGDFSRFPGLKFRNPLK